MDPVSLPARVATLVVAFLAVVAGVLWVVFDIIGPQPQTENYTPYAKNGAVDVTLMTTPQTTVTNKPDWVSYFIQEPATGQFDHTTYFAVPANTTVNVTILGYDGCTPLRNPLWGKVTGVAGDVENVAYFNGKTMSRRSRSRPSTRGRTARCSTPSRSRASASTCRSRPRRRWTRTTTSAARRPCVGDDVTTGNAPHTVVKFSFKTPKHARHLPLAVLRAVRRRLRGRQRRPDGPRRVT